MKKVTVLLGIMLCATVRLSAQTTPDCDKYTDCSTAKSRAGMGYQDAMFCYAMSCAQTPEEKLTYIRKSADKGYPPAQYFLGNSYMNGSGGLTQDLAAAVDLWKKSAVQGYFPAALQLADYYYAEKEEKNTALCWLEKANDIAGENRKTVPKENLEEFDRQNNLAELKDRIKQFRSEGYSCSKSDISQTEETSKSGEKKATYLRTDISEKTFDSDGGTQDFHVYSDGKSYSVSDVPGWCSVEYKSGFFTLSCRPNYGAYRMAILTIAADSKTASVHIEQTRAKAAADDIIAVQPTPFNSYKGDPRPFGLSVGYVRKQWDWKTDDGTTTYGAFDDVKNYVGGIQAGLRFEPQFKYGLGLNTGLFYEYYSSKSDEIESDDGDYRYTIKFTEHSLYLPLHLEYRVNISENFQVFVYAGTGFDYGLSAKVTATDPEESGPFFTSTDIYQNFDLGFPHKRFNASLDFGAGVRLSGFQVNIGTSRGLPDISSERDISIKQNKPFSVSLSWMIPSR
ncbi:MAG: outer membrane beta-barrel protein [Prevotellaceae bacterium]|jgi:hypothetical protein|nr:outer membrane beta-barrel protein [Prevotellaceae bacterium]